MYGRVCAAWALALGKGVEEAESWRAGTPIRPAMSASNRTEGSDHERIG